MVSEDCIEVYVLLLYHPGDVQKKLELTKLQWQF